VVPVTAVIARRAGELLGATGLAGHRCAIDAAVAATAFDQERRSQWAKRDWAVYVGQRVADDHEGIDSRNPLK